MDPLTLLSKVQASKLLTEPERAYWIKNMPKMTEEQLNKLDTILTEALSLSWGMEMQQYLSIASKATATLTH